MSLHAWEGHHHMDLTFEDCKLTYILTHRYIASIYLISGQFDCMHDCVMLARCDIRDQFALK